ncbi:hypothetical protein FQN60_007950 [Etheostoma spectabile]|uniref:Uncharacterized protein n=1 Tax=Etheostoma spectabile TaxID=54343 RepID=A0A5J5CV44_9PERO|nr:hypothetical protein FQN60_007950 [Etheostoma spectabile]
MPERQSNCGRTQGGGTLGLLPDFEDTTSSSNNGSKLWNVGRAV